MTFATDSEVADVEKIPQANDSASYDDPLVSIAEGDEALQLVGAEAKEHFSDEYNRRLRRKLVRSDLVIPPISAAVYFTQFLDKTSLNYASIMGFPVVGQDYNLVTMAFFIGYLVWQFPTAYISQRMRLGKYLGANILVWGVVLLLHSVANSFGAFFALRFILGMCESCVAPILILIVSMFYKKDEQASRIAYFYMMLGATQIFGGFVAYGISFYGGKALPPYKIVYFLLGGLAIAIGICVLVWLPDSPVHARMLTREERIAVLERVRNDQGGTESKKFKREQVVETFLDARTWLIVLATVLSNIPSGGLTNFSNIIIKDFGYSSQQTLVLATPAGAVGVVTTVLCGWYSDRTGERMLPIIFATVPTIVGVALLIGFNDSGQRGVLLFGTYLIGTYMSSLASIYAYNASNTSGYTKKLTINALTLVSYCVGSIIGTEIFPPKDAPNYIPGKTAIMIIFTVQLVVAFFLRRTNYLLNIKRKARLEEEKIRRGWTETDMQRERERSAFADLTDKQ
ncbi:MFS general substrate transporter [Leucogyrophana mollusca]|uniref:MFS general substrate transporter n=1 Tax=Leucogyrophana mollusca TaxID=85980 RepID=A0ACB8B5H6_9AGAM|nr:MFS general substrate transporter [Leucogyrophana mollusca]